MRGELAPALSRHAGFQKIVDTFLEVVILKSGDEALGAFKSIDSAVGTIPGDFLDGYKGDGLAVIITASHSIKKVLADDVSHRHG